MYAKDTNSVGNMVHTEEKTIRRSNILTRNRDSNKTLIGDSKRKRIGSRLLGKTIGNSTEEAPKNEVLPV